MPIPQTEAARRIDCLSAGLRGRGLRLTHQRLEVVREIAATDEHPDVETVYRNVRERVPTISLDTVYRSLGTLAELGLIRRVTATAGPARYDANASQHHHFVCTRCGRVRDVTSPVFDVLGPHPDLPLPGAVELVEVQFRGICRDCQSADPPPASARDPHRPPGPGK